MIPCQIHRLPLVYFTEIRECLKVRHADNKETDNETT